MKTTRLPSHVETALRKHKDALLGCAVQDAPGWLERAAETLMALEEAIAAVPAQAVPAARTPETVLRAMLRAYEAAALDQAISAARDDGAGALQSRVLWSLEDRVDAV